MQLIIPMSGTGQRFLKAGYKIPKPLIKVDNQEIISHVVNMFPGIESTFFICNKDHLENESLKLTSKLRKISPNCKIIPIDPHKKGPIYAILKSIKAFDPYLPTIVNYCDFNCLWDFERFKDHIQNSFCDGCVVTYSGFHPHMLGNTNYAYLKVEEDNIIDIQEKKPYTSNPMSEYASSGTYFFKSSNLMEKYFKKTIEKDLNVNGEYYVSMSYKAMIEDKLKLNIFNLDYFMQWGTPQDLKEYNWYSNLFKAKTKQISNKNNYLENTTLLMPCAGEGKRFADNGFTTPKPLIKSSNRPMLLNAIDDLPNTNKRIFIFRKEMQDLELIKSHLVNSYPKAIIKILNNKTLGQAHTCLLGLDDIDMEQPLIISACDNGAIYNFDLFKKLVEDDSKEIIVWGCRGYPGAMRNPEMYGWIEEKDNLIKKIHVKEIYKDKTKDPIVTGTFYFKKASIFKKIANELITTNQKVNNEFYVDSCINNAIEMNYNVSLFPIEFYLSWGTPNELKTFNYWQECLSKANYHIFESDNLTY